MGGFMNLLSELTLAGTYSGIEHRICEITTQIEAMPNVTVSGRFFYLTFRNEKITEEEFAQFAYEKIIRYCIPKKKYAEAVELFKRTNEERYITRLHDQARSLFVKSIKQHGAHLGEPGELIAFIILEAFFNAPQIACKMFLKTSEKMPVHGSDSVHVRFDSKTEALELIWGESKLYQDISNAFDKALESIAGFVGVKGTAVGERSPRDRDIDIICDLPNVNNTEMQQALCNYFDPYSEYSNKWKELFACFIGFDYALYNRLKGSTPDEIETYFREKYVERISSAYKLFGEKVIENNLSDLSFILILLPFKSINNFRNEFYRLLGYTSCDSEATNND